MIRSINILLLLFAVLFSFEGVAQQNKSVEKAVVKADTLRRSIGQQVVLTIHVQVPSTKKLLWPSIPDSLGKLEVVKRGAIDTLKGSEKNWKQYSQKLTVTSFDTGYIAFPKLPFRTGVGKDTSMIVSDSVILQYTTVAVDTTKAIKDIKDVMHAPLTGGEVLPWIFGVMALGAIAVIAYTVYLRKKSKKPLILFKPKPEVPAHVKALEALDHLKEESLWKKGRYKEFYTGLTDILREYLGQRFGVMAQEMTSDEILEAMTRLSLQERSINKLRSLFFTADMVKFAKGVPETNENEENMGTAYDFVETTKPVPVEEKAEKKPTEAEPTNPKSLTN